MIAYTVYNFNSRGSNALFWLSWAPRHTRGAQMHMQVKKKKKTYVQTNKKYICIYKQIKIPLKYFICNWWSYYLSSKNKHWFSAEHTGQLGLQHLQTRQHPVTNCLRGQTFRDQVSAPICPGSLQRLEPWFYGCLRSLWLQNSDFQGSSGHFQIWSLWCGPRGYFGPVATTTSQYSRWTALDLVCYPASSMFIESKGQPKFWLQLVGYLCA